jgi:subtilisin family serine protease
MAKHRAKANGEEAGAQASEAAAGVIQNLIRTALTTGTTGRYLVLFQPEAAKVAAKAMRDKAGVATVSSAEAVEASPAELGDRQLVLEHLGMAVVTMDPDQLNRVSTASEDSGFQSVIPERLLFPAVVWGGTPVPGQPFTAPYSGPGQPFAGPYGFGGPAMPPILSPGGGGDLAAYYWRLGFEAGLHSGGFPFQGGMPPFGFAAPLPTQELLLAQPWGEGVPTYPPLPFGAPGWPPPVAEASAQAAAFDESTATWGLQVINVLHSQFTGRGVRVAVLDTGFDFNHPDFPAGRVAGRASFVGEPDQDGHGHGTHCVGIACGPAAPPSGGPRYGVAGEADIYVGKVLPNSGSGAPEGVVIQGIEWAIRQKCRVISMSLSRRVQGPENSIYEQVGRAALKNGTVIVAAAGNDSNRPGCPGFPLQSPPASPPGTIAPVGSPANADSILGVGAIHWSMRVAAFSNRGLFPPGGAVDLVAPGMGIYSSASHTAQALPPTIKGLYRRLDGTSQATPFVAGVAALLAEARPDWKAGEIMDTIQGMAKALPNLDPRDVGQGLLQASLPTD